MKNVTSKEVSPERAAQIQALLKELLANREETREQKDELTCKKRKPFTEEGYYLLRERLNLFRRNLLYAFMGERAPFIFKEK